VNDTSDRPSAVFVCVAIAVVILLIAWCAYAASREWFVGDDFWFLALAQYPKSWRNWAEIFLPFGPRHWWSYRPLTTGVFFSVCFRLFGRDPFGYLAASLSMHLLTGLVVYRLGRQFGFESRVAVLTALLSISRYPSLTEGFWISVCQYTVTIFFYVLSLSLFIDYVRTGRIGFQVVSCAALVLTLLSNEMGATLVAVVVLTSVYLDGFSIGSGRWGATLRRVAPQVAITAVYLVFRGELIGPAEVPPMYRWVAGWHILANYYRALVFVFGAEPAALLGGLVPVIAALAALVSSRDKRGVVARALLGVSAVTSGWVVVGILPYVGMPFAHPRFSLSIEVPVCLLCGACLNAFATVYSARSRALVEGVLLAVLLLSLPYRATWDVATHPKGDTAKRLVSLLRERSANLSKGTAVVIRYGGNGLGTARESQEFWARVFGGAVFWAFFGDKDLGFHLVDVTRPPPEDLKCPPCIFFDLEPGQVLAPAAPAPLGVSGG
jgi:hypothetical protein